LTEVFRQASESQIVVNAHRINRGLMPELQPRDATDFFFVDAADPDGGGEPIPPPPFWGGYRIAVTEVEFWQGRDRRLHDRLRYRLDSSGEWLVERLAP